MYRFVVFCALVALVSANTQVSRCVNHSGALPDSTNIEGCTRPPCVLPQLQDAVIHLNFRAPRAIRSMRTLATAYLGVIPIPYDLGQNSVTCNFLTNANCPVSANQSLRYTLRMPIEPFFPVGTQVTVEFRVVDQDNGAVVCLRVPIRIAPPRA
ncbi:NPC intracellular cholesterol transporter 2-like [Helicoverpa armigera]|uniref:MD-2-related lipid-recognition domain-containing protein n=1 Tax=Helicoverpa armigera TaxID=29058 RepID=A0A2W1BYA3_HELAM|nr:hypothetical protein B5X24_HaOG201934 [Helicoverpa armigera]